MTARRVHLALFVSAGILAVAISSGHAGARNAAAAPDLERGRHLAVALGHCVRRHGENLAGGRPFVRDGVTIVAANLTPGAGGIAALSDAEVRRAIREGVRPDGTPLRVMPRQYTVMTDAGVTALVAYLRSLPPVDNGAPAAATSSALQPPVMRVDPPPNGGPSPLSDGEWRRSAAARIVTFGVPTLAELIGPTLAKKVRENCAMMRAGLKSEAEANVRAS
jgi:mono/diheme cytochrome c family protein